MQTKGSDSGRSRKHSGVSALIGRTISHYKIVEKIGGGMGVVYKADDLESNLPSALKFLPHELTANKDARNRFLREAEAVSVLDHPNICEINEISEAPDGRLFISMPYYTGESLRQKLERGPLPIQETVEIAHEIAAGLLYAHDNDIVHRDVKPENIFITSDGLVKLLDFGLAKVAGQLRVTPTGQRLGTLAYLSPEQARGDEVDHQTDIWSLGVVMYEMLTGRRPFRGENQAIVYSILNEDPPPVDDLRPDCPQHLADIVRRCLQKNKESRFSNLSEFIQQLKILAGGLRMDRALFSRPTKETPAAGAASTLGGVFWPAAAVITVLVVISVVIWWEIGGHRPPVVKETLMRVAVLPLENRSGGEPDDKFVEGLSETIASTAAGLEPFHKSMWVLPYSQTSAADFRVPGVARNAFGVNRLLSGEIGRHEPGYRLTLNVLDADTMVPVETRYIDFQRASAQSLQTDVYDAVADLLDADVPPEARPEVQPEGFAAVYYSYLEGVGAISHPDEPSDLDDAIDSLKHTIDDYPSFAAAYAWLAQAYLEKSRQTNDGQWLTLAETNCKKALQLDGKLARAQLTMAEVYTATNRSSLALQAYADALASNPHFTPANLRLGELLEHQNRSEDAEASYRKLIEVEPDYYQGHRALGQFYHERGRLDEAVGEYKTALRLAPGDWWTLNRLGAALLALGRWDEAADKIARSFSVGGRTALADIQTDPLLEELRNDPRFTEMVERRDWGSKAGDSPRH
jgi:serine/threonine protein kinase/Tfp pilus assembly protein PilF